MNPSLLNPAATPLGETISQMAALPQTQLDSLRIVLNGLEDLSFNQMACTEEEKVRLQQMEQVIVAHLRLLHREMQSLRAEVSRSQEQVQQLVALLQSQVP